MRAQHDQIPDGRKETMKPTVKPVKKGRSVAAKKLEKKPSLALQKPLLRYL